MPAQEPNSMVEADNAHGWGSIGSLGPHSTTTRLLRERHA